MSDHRCPWRLGRPALVAASIWSCAVSAAPSSLRLERQALWGGKAAALGRPANAGGFAAVCASPRALVAADLDEDGVDDVAVGCAAGAGGIVVIHRGNPAALRVSPARSPQPPFSRGGSVVVLPLAAEHLAAGDFDADGHQDLVVSAGGATTLLLLRGDGLGGFEPARPIELPGPVAALRAGEVNRRDGLADLAVAIGDVRGGSLLLYQSSAGAFGDAPAAVPLPGRAREVAFGELVGILGRDVAVATGAGLVVVRGAGEGVAHATHPEPEFALSGIAATALAIVEGSAGGGGVMLATSEDGDLHRVHWLPAPAPGGWPPAPGGWVHERAALGATATPRGAIALVSARLSTSGRPDVLVIDPAANELAVLVLPGVEHSAEPPVPARSLAADDSSNALPVSGNPGRATREEEAWPMVRRVVARGAVSAALVLRANGDALDDLVVLERGSAQPIVLGSRTTAVYTVNSTADSSDGTCDVQHCTLREAILAANASAGADTIEFALPGLAPITIAVTSDLPDALEAVTIDGTTQPQYAGTPLVVLDGSATTGPQGWGLSIRGGSSTVRGLALHGFAAHSAIVFWEGGGNVAEGNFVGTVSGATALGTGSGIDVARSSGNTIGGTTLAARNLIVGATLPAIVVREGSSENVVRGNYVGLDPTGSVALPNAGNDIVLYDSTANTIGGTTAASRNVVTGGPDPTIASVGIASNIDPDPVTNASDNLVSGNYLGTDASGNVGLGPAGVSLFILDASNNTIGGGAGNVIADSDGVFAVGVRPLALAATANTISNNTIGVGADGATALGHAGPGVRIYGPGAAANSVVGNTIRNNRIGVVVREDAGSGNTISQNRISVNAQLGIDLGVLVATGEGGPTENDPVDADAGPNDLQNFPVLGSLKAGAVTGTLESSPNSAFTVELFVSAACDDSGFGEGDTYLISVVAQTDGAGRAVFTVTPATPLVERSFLTATATNGAGSTSELSRCQLVGFFADGFETGSTALWSVTVGQGAAARIAAAARSAEAMQSGRP